MSAIESNQPVWSKLSNENLDSKYEKCRNITEEIYKRINITFQIKKLETGSQSDESDNSDAIDSNELSNETDLFACDSRDSLSSTGPETPGQGAERPGLLRAKFININNNEERRDAPSAPAPVPAPRRSRKRFRKRVKKRQQALSPESDGSSDSALPLSRMVPRDARPDRRDKSDKSDRRDKRDKLVPNIIIITKDFKPRIKTPERKLPESTKDNAATDSADAAMLDSRDKSSSHEIKACTMCSLSFRGERGLRRHMNMTHVTKTP